MSSVESTSSATSFYQFSTLLSLLEEVNDTKTILVQKFKSQWDVKKWRQGFFIDEYIYEINVHWLKFAPPTTASFFTLGILYLVIMTVGVFGNGLVIFLFCKCKTLHTPANVLITNLAMSDVLMLLKMPIFIYNCFYKGPILGDIACRIYGFIGGLSGTASIGTLAAISFDRYFVIRFPLKRYSNVRIYICMFSTWIYALTFSLVPLLNIGVGKYQYEGYLTSCSFDYLSDSIATKTFIWIFFCAAFLIPMCIIVYSYYEIFRIVSGRTTKVSTKRDSLRHVKEEDTRKQEMKLAIITLVVIFLWFFSWTPYAIIAWLGILGQKHLITPLASMIPALFCKTTSAVDPYVYALSHPKFRQEIWKYLGVKGKNKQKKKVWSTEMSSANYDTKSYCDVGAADNDDVEEEIVEIEFQTLDLREFCGESDNLRHTERKLKRETSKASLLCLNPTFSNNIYGFRRISRKFSAHNRTQNNKK